jgi:predicted Zn-ribbon and HTH transcriptional regulator
MDPNRFLDLLPKVEIIATSTESLFMAQNRVIGCEECDPAAANRRFTAVLDEVTHRQDSVTDYILCEPARCGKCGARIIESTLVVLQSPDSEHSGLLYFDIPIEETNVVLVDEDLVSEAEGWIASCEHCFEDCEHSFDQILDSLTTCDPTSTEYLMRREATCPRCQSSVTEKTLVNPL